MPSDPQFDHWSSLSVHQRFAASDGTDAGRMRDGGTQDPRPSPAQIYSNADTPWGYRLGQPETPWNWPRHHDSPGVQPTSTDRLAEPNGATPSGPRPVVVRSPHTMAGGAFVPPRWSAHHESTLVRWSSVLIGLSTVVG
jgi:hypothetical protein